MASDDRDCWLCGGNTNRLCWCHDDGALDARWCRCNPRVHVSPSIVIDPDSDPPVTVRTVRDIYGNCTLEAP